MKPLAIIPSLVLAASAGLPASAQQPAYPGPDPVKIIVPVQAGGGVDVVARVVAKHLGDRLRGNFIVENKAGAGGTLGADSVAKATPDGHTLLFTAQGPVIVSPFLMKSLPYDARTAFAPVSLVAVSPNILSVHPDFPARTLKEFIAYAKANPDKATVATQGVGTTGHLTSLLLNRRLGISLTHVPYKGFPGLVTDIVSGRVSMTITDTTNTLGLIRQGKLRPIAIAAQQRNPLLPNVPTFAELTYPEITTGPWFALLAPAGTPPQTVEKLAAQVREIVKIPAVEKQFAEMGLEVTAKRPADFNAFYQAEYKRWGHIIQDAGLAGTE